MPSAEGIFPRRYRLLKPDDFRRVFNANERSTDQYFTVLARTNDLGYARLGMAITKKNTRRAVDRNRLKRLIRESFRIHKSLLAGLDLVVLNRSGNLSTDNSRYHASLSAHWQRLARKCNIS